jgi:prepilin-type N-terminal cleavage/methylation domain-containing protein
LLQGIPEPQARIEVIRTPRALLDAAFNSRTDFQPRKEFNHMLKKFRLNRDQKGFTLIELLIVVAIIGILAAIAIPQFASYRERAFHTASQSDLRNFKTSMEAYYADNQEYPAAFVAGAN